MKIKSGRLQQIIKEELNAVLKEMYNPENDDIYMIAAELSRSPTGALKTNSIQLGRSQMCSKIWAAATHNIA
jgi:hypothetical protein